MDKLTARAQTIQVVVANLFELDVPQHVAVLIDKMSNLKIQKLADYTSVGNPALWWSIVGFSFNKIRIFWKFETVWSDSET